MPGGVAGIGNAPAAALAVEQGQAEFQRIAVERVRHLVHERFDHEHVVRVRDRAQRAGLHGPGGTVAVEGADAMVLDVVPMVAAADRPLIDVLLLGVPGIELQPVGPVFLTDGEARRPSSHSRCRGPWPQVGRSSDRP